MADGLWCAAALASPHHGRPGADGHGNGAAVTRYGGLRVGPGHALPVRESRAMKTLDMNTAKAWFSYAVLRLGRCGVAGVSLLCACAVVVAGQAVHSNRDTLTQRIDQARADLKNAAPAARPAATAQSFLAQLPAAEQVPRFIEGVHQLAQSAGVQIERAEYRAPVLASGQVLRSQVVLPLTGSYPGIARWLGQVLSQHPSAAIDELSLQREVAAGEPVRARVVLSHYSRVLP